MYLNVNRLLISCIVALVLSHSVFAQWESPEKVKTYPEIVAKLIVMTHGEDNYKCDSLTISPDGTKIAVASEPDVIPKAPVGVKFDPGANRATTLGKQTWQGWRKVACTPARRGKVVRCVPVSGYIGIFDVTSGDCITRLCDPDDPEYKRVFWSKDGNTLVGQTEKRTVIWDVSTSTIKSEIPRGGPITLSPEGDHILMFTKNGDDEPSIYRYDTKDGHLAAKIKVNEQLVQDQHGIAYSPDGKYFSVGFCIWDAITGKVVMESQAGDDDNDLPLWFTPDSTRLASGAINDCDADDFRIQTLRDSKPNHPFSKEELKDSCLKDSPLVSDIKHDRFDSPQVVSTDLMFLAVTPEKEHEDNPQVQLWLYSIETGGILAKLTGPDGAEQGADVERVAISTNNKTVAASRDDGGTLIWDISKFQTITSPKSKP